MLYKEQVAPLLKAASISAKPSPHRKGFLRAYEWYSSSRNLRDKIFQLPPILDLNTFQAFKLGV